MAYTNLPALSLVGTVFSSPTSSVVIDASGEKAAMVFIAPLTGDINKVTFGVNAVTTSQTLKVSIQTIDSSGDPSGTILNSGNAYGTQTSPAATTSYQVTLGTAASVTAGTQYAAVIEFDSTVGNLSILAAPTPGTIFPSSRSYRDAYAGSWSKGGSATSINLGLCYNVGGVDTYVELENSLGGYTIDSGGQLSISTGSDPDQVGNKWTTPYAVKIVGLVAGYSNVSYAFDLILYAADGTTVLGSNSFDPAKDNNGYPMWARFDPVEVAASTVVYGVLKPTTVYGFGLYHRVHYANANCLGSIGGGSAMHYCQKTDSGAWSMTTTARGNVGFLISAIDPGGGTSSGGGSYGY